MNRNKALSILTLTLLLSLPIIGVYATFKDSFAYTNFNSVTATWHELDENRTSWTITVFPELVWNTTDADCGAKLWLGNGTDGDGTDILSFNMNPDGDNIDFELYRGDVEGTWNKLLGGTQSKTDCEYTLRLDTDGDLYIGNATDYDAYTSSPLTYGTTNTLSHIGTLGVDTTTATGGYITVEVKDYSLSTSQSLLSIMPSLVSLMCFGVAIGLVSKFMSSR